MSGAPRVLVSARGLSYAFGAGARVLDRVSFELCEGEFVAVLGPNGAGKSTFVRLLAGLAQPLEGTLDIDGASSRALSRGAWAKRVSLVPQFEDARFGFTVRELVAMGRAPHSGYLGVQGAHDETHPAVQQALERCDLVHLADRMVDTLSGGEHKRVLVARALAQGAPVMLLDEPAASLDVRHQLALCELLAGAVQARACGAVAVLHDLNLATQYCDRVLLLREGRVFAQGPTREVLTRDAVRAVFDVAVYEGTLENGARFFVPQRG